MSAIRFSASALASVASGLVALFGASPSRADLTTLYNDTGAQSGAFHANGGATSTTPVTALVADDITAGAGLGGLPVNQITFTVNNGGTTSTTFTPELLFYKADGTGGGPGTLIDQVNVNPLTLAAGGGSSYSISSTAPGGYFTMPTGLFWAGVVFTGGGTNSATAAQLNGLGMDTFNPPTVGTSKDVFFASNGQGGGGNNPDGGFYFLGGNPVANFGFGFASVQAVPEPSAIALVAIGGLLLGGSRLVHRRRSAS